MTLQSWEFQKRLRSVSSNSLSVRRTRLSTYSDRAFPVSAARVWNSLLQHVITAPSLPVFRSRLRTRFLVSVTRNICRTCEVTFENLYSPRLVETTKIRE